MLDSIYHMTLKITLKSHFCHKNVIIVLCTQGCYGQFVGPGLGLNCLQRLSADNKVMAHKERIKDFSRTCSHTVQVFYSKTCVKLSTQKSTKGRS